jgi:hypothetical protein
VAGRGEVRVGRLGLRWIGSWRGPGRAVLGVFAECRYQAAVVARTGGQYDVGRVDSPGCR